MITGRLFVKFLSVYFFLTVLAASIPCAAKPQSVPVYTFRTINSYVHDRDAFTQGLVFENGILYEGTGLYGKSSLRKVDLETGTVLQFHPLPSEYFGEGITIFRDAVIQLTWQSRKGFVYNKNSFEVLRDFGYETEGWGITTDGKHLIMSDGTSTLYILDPVTLKTTGRIQVHDDGRPVDNLNELEYVKGLIYANVWYSDNIAMIDLYSGRVTGWIDLSGILPPQNDGKRVDVLNGIAYDAKMGRLFVTGKLWPQLFEIELVRKY